MLNQINWAHTLENLIQWMQDRGKAIGSSNVVLGISGGKDSSVVAALCVKAYGKDHVYGVIMPDGKQDDLDYATGIGDFLGISYDIINISQITDAFWEEIGSISSLTGISKQSKLNLPPRVRMTLLYAIAQSKDAIVINTSNLSEDWVGYATIYGDTTGAFSPLATFTTDEVIALGRELGLPEKFIKKPPSDGLTGKTDEDVLGFSYEILNYYIRTGRIEDPNLKQEIDRLHRNSRFKFQTIPMFDSGFPILAEDVAHIYD